MKDRFKELSDKWPDLSSLLVFGRLIRITPKEGWNRRKIAKWFNTLVDPEDYAKSEKQSLINFLCQTVA